MSFPYIIQGNNITVVIDGKPHTVASSHPTFARLKEAVKVDDWDTVEDLIEPKKTILKYGKGHVSIQGDKLFWKNEEMHNSLTMRIINMLQEGFSVEPMVAFMENLMSNPSKRAVNELYGFLEKNQLPITPDGHFLAYKKVRETYMDIHSDTMLNKPQYLLTAAEKAQLPYTERGVTAEIVNGETVLSMERNRVDDNKDRTCSEGLHFCGMSYLNHFGNSTTDRIVVLEINPADVVSIPSDYNDAKGRTCRYVVLSDLNVSPEDAFKAPVQTDAVGSSAPTPVAQEYDSRGRPLSMTPGAIRKRQLRAAAKEAGPKAKQITDSWPAPKKR